MLMHPLKREALVTIALEVLVPLMDGAADEEKYAAAGTIAGLVIDAIDPYVEVKDSALDLD